MTQSDGGAFAPADPEQAMLTPAESGEMLSRARAEIARVIVGQGRVVERVLVALLAGGHCLLEGAPGLGKTRLLTTLATAVGGSFSRIQFTPDLLPSDIVGTRIWRQEEGRFSVELGPVFANFVLADEINRAPAKVQSALLEVMAEQQVSIGGETFAVDRPFLVLATQNPIESEGVYQLPEAQRDRFLMKVPVDYPAGAHEEMEIVRRAAGDAVEPREVLTREQLMALQTTTRAIHVDPRVADYAVRLVMATRDPARHHLDSLAPLIAFGASPRASIGLVEGARALALLRGKGAVEPQEIYDIAYDVLNHRLVMSFDAVADGIGVGEVLYHVLTTVPAPQLTGPPNVYGNGRTLGTPSGSYGPGLAAGPPRIPEPTSAADLRASGSPVPPSADPRVVAASAYGVSRASGEFPGQRDARRGLDRLVAAHTPPAVPAAPPTPQDLVGREVEEPVAEEPVPPELAADEPPDPQADPPPGDAAEGGGNRGLGRWFGRGGEETAPLEPPS